MSSKEQKTPNEQVPEEMEVEQHAEVEAAETAEAVDTRDEQIANLQAQLAEAESRERDIQLRHQADMDNLRRRTAIDIDRGEKRALEKFAKELLPVIDSLERALQVADKANADLLPMIEGIELTLKSMLDVVSKFGVEVIGDINVPFNPDVHQAIAMVDADGVASNHVVMVMQKGYVLNGIVVRAAMVSVAK